MTVTLESREVEGRTSRGCVTDMEGGTGNLFPNISLPIVGLRYTSISFTFLSPNEKVLVKVKTIYD